MIDLKETRAEVTSISHKEPVLRVRGGEQCYLARSTYEVAQVGSLHGSEGGWFTVRKKFSIVKTDGCKMPWLRITGLRRM